MEHEEYQEITKDRFYNAVYGLWNALLTVNGIILAVFSALYAIAPSRGTFFVRSIICMCVCSACLMVFNFIATKWIYSRIAELILNPPNRLTDEEREKDHKQVLWRHKAVNYSENIALILFFMEVCFIAMFVFELSK